MPAQVKTRQAASLYLKMNRQQQSVNQHGDQQCTGKPQARAPRYTDFYFAANINKVGPFNFVAPLISSK
jgi:hypothetical protein